MPSVFSEAPLQKWQNESTKILYKRSRECLGVTHSFKDLGQHIWSVCKTQPCITHLPATFFLSFHIITKSSIKPPQELMTNPKCHSSASFLCQFPQNNVHLKFCDSNIFQRYVFSASSLNLPSGFIFSHPHKNVNRYYSFGETSLAFPFCCFNTVLPPCAKGRLVPTKHLRKCTGKTINNAIVFKTCAKKELTFDIQGKPNKVFRRLCFPAIVIH